MKADRRVIALLLALTMGWTGLVVAGSLTPPGAPMSTQKPLAEVEPRIAINAENTPGDTTSLFRITRTGSYYLTGNITGVAGKNGISIIAEDVTIDLNGFTMTGVASSLDGIQGTAGAVVRNGTITNWGDDGVSLGAGAVVESVIASGNLGNGITISSGIVQNCVARLNRDIGLTVMTGVLSDSTSQQNSRFGIYVGGGSVVTRCTSSDNRSHGVFVYGESVLVSRCSISRNDGCGITGIAPGFGNGVQKSMIVDCAVYQNKQHGILCLDCCLVLRCTVTANTASGIETRMLCTIRDNLCDSNGSDGSGAGIRAIHMNRIEGNICTDNARGIQVVSGFNIILQNACAGNTEINWSIVAGNLCHVVVPNNAAAILGDAGGDGTGLTRPLSNFTY